MGTLLCTIVYSYVYILFCRVTLSTWRANQSINIPWYLIVRREPAILRLRGEKRRTTTSGGERDHRGVDITVLSGTILDPHCTSRPKPGALEVTRLVEWRSAG